MPEIVTYKDKVYIEMRYFRNHSTRVAGMHGFIICSQEIHNDTFSHFDHLKNVTK